jgi:hypothetical protein
MERPVLIDIVRQHAETAAFLWVVYDDHLLHPQDNPDMNAVGLERLIERLEAHLDGLRTAGEHGLKIAQQSFDQYGERGELFVLKMLQTDTRDIRIRDLDLAKVRDFIYKVVKA